VKDFRIWFTEVVVGHLVADRPVVVDRAAVPAEAGIAEEAAGRAAAGTVAGVDRAAVAAVVGISFQTLKPG
jgi:hypothetical protein